MALRSLVSYHTACLSKNRGIGSTGVTDVELQHLTAMVTAVEPDQLSALRVTLEASPASVAHTLVFVLERAVAGGEKNNTQQQNRDHTWRLLVRLVQLYAQDLRDHEPTLTCLAVI